MLAADGALCAPPVRTRRGGRPSPRDPPGVDRDRRPDRVACRERRHRRPRRHPPRGLRRLPAVQRLMAAGGLFSTPRPEPGHLVPALGGAVLIVVALPVFLLLGWPVSGWALAAVIWVFVHGLDY